MKLRDFVARMHAGWGFARPATPKRIGLALATLFKGSLELDAEVTAAFRVQHNRSGSTSYIWDVTGATVPQFLWLVESESETDRIFGRGNGAPSSVHPTPEGFRVMYVR